MRIQLNETFYKNYSYTHRYDEFAAQTYVPTEVLMPNDKIGYVVHNQLPILLKEEFDVIS